MEETWDGEPVAREAPFACCVVVWREAAVGGREFLVLHRAHAWLDVDGDWAWTPPSGARRPGEDPDAAAVRELSEETGLELPFARVEPLTEEVALYLVEAPADAEVTLDAEHDAFRWLPLEEAAELCLPVRVGEALRHAAASAKTCPHGT